MTERWKNVRKYLPTFTVVTLAVALVSFILLLVSKHSCALGNAINATVSSAFRFIMAKISSIFPFSLFEVLMYLLLPIIALIVIVAVKVFRDRTARIRYALTLLGVVAIIFTGYVFALAIPYTVTPLASRLELPSVEITEDNLYDTAKLLLDEANALSEKLEKNESGSTVMPYSLDELSEKISVSYSRLAETHDFIQSFSSRVKPIATEGAMSSLHLLGIYTYFTGESNINVHYPDFNIPFTTAHEFAHQRGIIRENEANFIAFLVCLESDDDYIKYSGYLNLYQYLASALYRTSADRYRVLLDGMSDAVRSEIIADREAAEKYKDSLAGKISGFLNDRYLKMNGTEGEISYGLVTRLAVAYYSEK